MLRIRNRLFPSTQGPLHVSSRQPNDYDKSLPLAVNREDMASLGQLTAVELSSAVPLDPESVSLARFHLLKLNRDRLTR